MESNKVAVLNASLEQALSKLEGLLGELRAVLLRDAALPIFVNDERSSAAQHRLVVNALTKLHYEDGQAPNEVIHCPALLGVSDQTLVLADRINVLKADLHETLKAFDKVRVIDPAGGRDKVPALKVSLQRLGHARLQRRQATRRIETLDAAPESATFTWSHARRKQAMTAVEVREQLLRDLANAGYERQADRVAALAADLTRLDSVDDDTPLVRLFAPYCHPRVNLVWSQSNGKLIRKQRRAVVPLLYPADPGDPLPIIRPLPASPGEGPQRIRRRDARVEEDPLLPSLGIHRVIPVPV